jgi:hypothetical protein
VTAGRARLTVTFTAALAAGFLALAGCSSDGEVRPAPAASAAPCGTALAAAPTTVLGKARTPLDVAGALAYGSPAIVLRCGLPALAPTSQQCLQVDDVDWVLTADTDPLVFATYGRAPALEVRVPASVGRENAPAALGDLAAVARSLPSNGRGCLG